MIRAIQKKKAIPVKNDFPCNICSKNKKHKVTGCWELDNACKWSSFSISNTTKMGWNNELEH